MQQQLINLCYFRKNYFLNNLLHFQNLTATLHHLQC